MRRIISTTLVAMSLVAVTAIGVTAQDEPAAVAITPAGLNADKIDGRHAVGHGASVKKRAGKLVATNKRGQLPSNIVKPAWRLILGKPAAFRDGKITWGEVQGMPPGFADGVDHVGVTGLKVTRLSASDTLKGNSAGDLYSPPCPAGSSLVGGGHVPSHSFMHNVTSYAVGDQWFVTFENTGDPDRTMQSHVYCLSVEPAVAITTVNKAARLRTATGGRK